MIATARKDASVKYTTVLPASCIDELKYLTDKKIILSVSQGIRMAIENFLAIQKQQEYASLMKEAAQDKEFVKRTMDAQEHFSIVDSEGVETW